MARMNPFKPGATAPAGFQALLDAFAYLDKERDVYENGDEWYPHPSRAARSAGLRGLNPLDALSRYIEVNQLSAGDALTCFDNFPVSPDLMKPDGIIPSRWPAAEGDDRFPEDRASDDDNMAAWLSRCTGPIAHSTLRGPCLRAMPTQWLKFLVPLDPGEEFDPEEDDLAPCLYPKDSEKQYRDQPECLMVAPYYWLDQNVQRWTDRGPREAEVVKYYEELKTKHRPTRMLQLIMDTHKRETWEEENTRRRIWVRDDTYTYSELAYALEAVQFMQWFDPMPCAILLITVYGDRHARIVEARWDATREMLVFDMLPLLNLSTEAIEADA